MTNRSKNIILSIEEQHARSIFDVVKHWEYRKVPPAIHPPYTMFLYITGGDLNITGYTKVDRVIKDAPDSVIGETVEETPHTREDLEGYFGDHDEVGALHISGRYEYDDPIEYREITDVITDFTAPQNFTYITQQQADLLTSLREPGSFNLPLSKFM